MIKDTCFTSLLIAAVVIPILSGFACGDPGPSGMCNEPLITCAADVAPPGGDGFVLVDDLLAVINTWDSDGSSTGLRPQGDCAPQPNGDCMVDVDDLLMIIEHWGQCSDAGACCLRDQSCIETSDFACNQQNGTFQGGSCFSTPLCPTAQANDECDNAFYYSPSGFTFWINDYATTDGPAGKSGNGCEEFIARDLWYRKEDTCPNLTRVALSPNGGETVRMIAVYEGWSCPPGELLGCAIGTGSLHVLVSLEANQPFTVRVGTPADVPHGEGYLSIFCP